MSKLVSKEIVSVEPSFDEIKKWYHENLHPDANQYDEPEVYKYVYHEARWAGIFQCTSDGAQKFFVKAKPESITDIAALTSIYRPGPLAAHVDKIYLKAKRGEKFEWGHPIFEKVLGDTYNCLVFQEACLTGDTLVASKDGDTRLDALKPGQSIRSFNEITRQFENDEVTLLMNKGIQELIEIETSRGTLKITPDHKVFTKKGWIEAGDLKLDDEIVISAIYTKRCEICRELFTTYKENQRFDKRECVSQWKSIAYSGRKLTPEWLENQRKSKLRENWVRYGTYKCEVCNLEFETNTALRSHRSYCSNQHENKNVECLICLKMFKRQRNLTVHMNYHDENYAKEIGEKISKAIADRPQQKSTSLEEKNFGEQILKPLYGNIVSKFRIEGIRHEYDFYVPHLNLIVEYDGDYYHGYKKTQKILSKWQKIQHRIDQSNTLAALAKGYKIHRVWGSESKNYPHDLRVL